MSQKIINDVTVITPDGQEVVFQGVGDREVTMPAPGVLVMNLTTALGTPLGAVFIKQGMIFKYSDGKLTSAQIDAEMGMVKKRSEADDANN